MVIFCADSGARPGEVTALEHKHVGRRSSGITTAYKAFPRSIARRNALVAK
jgi:hypothetical protein